MNLYTTDQYKPENMRYKSKEEAIEDHVANYKSDGVAKGKGGMTSSDYERVGFIIDHVPSGSHVLDVGCNGGTLGIHLLGPKKCRVKGVDVVPRLVEKAKKRGIFAEVGEAEDLSRYEDNTFDCVLCCEVLEHLYDPIPAIREAYRVLKPGGRYIITVPAPGGEMNGPDRLGDYHQQNFTIESLDTVIYSAFKRDTAFAVGIPYSKPYCHSLTRNEKEYNAMRSIPQWIGIVVEKEKENDE
jgi:SAM-dependent methyltransferase